MKERFITVLKKWWLFVLLAIAVVAGLWAGYTFQNDWTGFRDYEPETDVERGKTLWDWLDLLIVPAVLAIGAYWFNAQNQNTERGIASERNQEAALQIYLDRMTELLLNKDLRNSEPGSEVRTVARMRTLTILNSVEKERRTVVVRFLVEAGLVSVESEAEESTESVVSLNGANLKEVDLRDANLDRADLGRANLEGVDLRTATLRRANLWNSKLSGADLKAVNLEQANLEYARLIGADLSGANLKQAKLKLAILQKANLVGADLTRTDLVGANLTGASLERAHLGQADLRGSTLPNGEKWTEDTDMSRFTNPKE